MTYTEVSFVKARGRGWVDLPDITDVYLVLQPLGESDDEITGIYIPLEPVVPATFHLSDSPQVGDYRSVRLFWDMGKLGFRSRACPLRSFARAGFELRPYQLVPVLMSFKLDPIRLLVANDVGMGKTMKRAQ